jgi:tripartite-type tricarboxylate transporter receptor subunit TctC
MKRTTWLVLLAAAMFATTASGPAQAQTYPNGTIKILVGFPPGGTTDIIARDVGQELEKAWHTAVIVENRAGANGALAAAQLAKLPPDGQTLMMIVSGHITNPLIMANAGYDALKDSTAISLLASSPLAIIRALPQTISRARSRSPRKSRTPSATQRRASARSSSFRWSCCPISAAPSSCTCHTAAARRR